MRSLYHQLLATCFLLAACAQPTSAPADESARATEISGLVAKELSERLTLLVPEAVTTEEAALAAAAEPPAAALPTPTPTGPPTPASVSVSEDPAQSLGLPNWRDPFDSSINWYLYEDDHTRVELQDGNLLLTALNPDGWSGWALSWPILSDFYLEATITPEACAGLDRYGLVFRSLEIDRAYLFGFTCDGSYALRLWDESRFIMLKNWTVSDAIHSEPGVANRIGVMAQADSLALYANGQLLTEVKDETLNEGAFGLFIGSVNTTMFKIRVEEISYWDLSD